MQDVSNISWSIAVQGILQFIESEVVVKHWGKKMIPEKSFLTIGHICLNIAHVGNFNGKVKLRNKKMIKSDLY